MEKVREETRRDEAEEGKRKHTEEERVVRVLMLSFSLAMFKPTDD